MRNSVDRASGSFNSAALDLLKKSKVTHWITDDVIEWLRASNFEEYENIFLEHKING